MHGFLVEVYLFGLCWWIVSHGKCVVVISAWVPGKWFVCLVYAGGLAVMGGALWY